MCMHKTIMLLKPATLVSYLLYKPVCPEGMQVFPGQVGQGKNTVCDFLRRSAVDPIHLSLYSLILLSSDL